MTAIIQSISRWPLLIFKRLILYVSCKGVSVKSADGKRLSQTMNSRHKYSAVPSLVFSLNSVEVFSYDMVLKVFYYY